MQISCHYSILIYLWHKTYDSENKDHCTEAIARLSTQFFWEVRKILRTSFWSKLYVKMGSSSGYLRRLSVFHIKIDTELNFKVRKPCIKTLQNEKIWFFHIIKSFVRSLDCLRSSFTFLSSYWFRFQLTSQLIPTLLKIRWKIFEKSVIYCQSLKWSLEQDWEWLMIELVCCWELRESYSTWAIFLTSQ